MPTPQKIIDAAASLVHQRCLKERGYRKKARAWTLGTKWPRVIGIQLSQWNSAAEASFTVNLGISLPEIRATMGLPAVEAPLKDYNCDLRARLGRLIHGKDHWWKVTAADDPERVAEEILAGLESHGFPWFESFTSYLEVARASRSSRSYEIRGVVALQMAGEPEEAARALAGLLEDANPVALRGLRRVALQCGIALPPGEG